MTGIYGWFGPAKIGAVLNCIIITMRGLSLVPDDGKLPKSLSGVLDLFLTANRFLAAYAPGVDSISP